MSTSSFCEVVLAARDEVGEARARARDAEAGVQVRALEIGVDRHHAVALARERDRQVRDQEGLADAALAAAHGDHAAPPAAARSGSRASRVWPSALPIRPR